ncbi:hypothetical protein BC829DRAFT_431839 [Chytridium lagenaria]|nr:hypothetical protein BC829DRAFT_431839 [Chytridium lagenaria]
MAKYGKKKSAWHRRKSGGRDRSEVVVEGEVGVCGDGQVGKGVVGLTQGVVERDTRPWKLNSERSLGSFTKDVALGCETTALTKPKKKNKKKNKKKKTTTNTDQPEEITQSGPLCENTGTFPELSWPDRSIILSSETLRNGSVMSSLETLPSSLSQDSLRDPKTLINDDDLAKSSEHDHNPVPAVEPSASSSSTAFSSTDNLMHVPPEGGRKKRKQRVDKRVALESTREASVKEPADESKKPSVSRNSVIGKINVQAVSYASVCKKPVDSVPALNETSVGESMRPEVGGIKETEPASSGCGSMQKAAPKIETKPEKKLKDTVTEKKLKDTVTDKKLKDTVTEKKLKDTVTEKKLKDTVTEKKLKDTVTEKKLKDTVTEKKLKDTVTEKKLKDTATEKKLKDTATEKKLKDTVTEKKLKDTATEKKLKDTVTEKKLKGTVTEKKFKDTAAEKKIEDTAVENVKGSTQFDALEKPTALKSLVTDPNHSNIGTCGLSQSQDKEFIATSKAVVRKVRFMWKMRNTLPPPIPTQIKPSSSSPKTNVDVNGPDPSHSSTKSAPKPTSHPKKKNPSSKKQPSTILTELITRVSSELKTLKKLPQHPSSTPLKSTPTPAKSLPLIPVYQWVHLNALIPESIVTHVPLIMLEEKGYFTIAYREPVDPNGRHSQHLSQEFLEDMLRKVFVKVYGEEAKGLVWKGL